MPIEVGNPCAVLGGRLVLLDGLAAWVEPCRQLRELLDLTHGVRKVEAARRGEAFRVDERPIVIRRNVSERNLAALWQIERTKALPLSILECVAVGAGYDVLRREEVRDRSTAPKSLERITRARLVDELDIRVAGPKELRERETDEASAEICGRADAPIFLQGDDQLTAPVALDLAAPRKRQRDEAVTIEQLKRRLKEGFTTNDQQCITAVAVRQAQRGNRYVAWRPAEDLGG